MHVWCGETITIAHEQLLVSLICMLFVSVQILTIQSHKCIYLYACLYSTFLCFVSVWGVGGGGGRGGEGGADRMHLVINIFNRETEFMKNTAHNLSKIS